MSEPMSEPQLLQHDCNHCPDAARGYDREQLQRWFIWHIYWCHLDIWIEKVGEDRPPRDPQPAPLSIWTNVEPGTRGTLTLEALAERIAQEGT